MATVIDSSDWLIALIQAQTKPTWSYQTLQSLFWSQWQVQHTAWLFMCFGFQAETLICRTNNNDLKPWIGVTWLFDAPAWGRHVVWRHGTKTTTKCHSSWTKSTKGPSFEAISWIRPTYRFVKSLQHSFWPFVIVLGHCKLIFAIVLRVRHDLEASANVNVIGLHVHWLVTY